MKFFFAALGTVGFVIGALTLDPMLMAVTGFIGVISFQVIIRS